MRTSLILTPLVISFLIVTIGCGGNASPAATSTNPPAAPTATPPSTPPSSGGGSPSTAPFQQTLSSIVNFTPTGEFGTVSVSDVGDVNIQVKGAQKSASYAWTFCKFSGTCFDLGQMLLTDGSGNGQLTFHFPQTGNWSGYFSGKSTNDTIDTQDSAHHAQRGNLVSYNAVNGQAPCDPNVRPGCNLDTAHGTVTVANKVAHIVLQGGSPNTAYEIVLYGGGATQGTINTDGSGNVTADLPVLAGIGTTYVFRPLNSKSESVTGFTVK